MARHEFADFAVSTRQCFDKPPVLIHKLKGEAVHFRITKKHAQALLGVVQALRKPATPPHRTRCPGCTSAAWVGFQATTTPVRRSVRRRIGDLFGMPLPASEVLKGGIVFVVDFRCIQRMIAMIMVNHERTELFQTFLSASSTRRDCSNLCSWRHPSLPCRGNQNCSRSCLMRSRRRQPSRIRSAASRISRSQTASNTGPRSGP